MISPAFRLFCLFWGLMVWVVVSSDQPLHAGGQESATAWQQQEHSRLRLLASSRVPFRGKLRTMAAVQIELDQGWKTYWRTPLNGFPPTLDWAASTNLEAAKVLWPAPERLPNATGLLAFGYKKAVTFPVLVTPKDEGKPVQLSLRIKYGVCKNVCIPIETDLRLAVSPSTGTTYRRVLRSALERVPKRQRRGVYCPHRLLAAKRRTVNGKPSLLIKTAYQEQVTDLDLFVEAQPGIELPVPARQPLASRGRLYHVLSFGSASALDALKGKTLTLTMTADQGSCETNWRVK